MSESLLDFRSALRRVVEVESGLEISDPVTMKVKRVYPYTPSRISAAPARPFIMHSWTLVAQNRKPNGWDNPQYELRIQLCVEDADLERAADIATAFHEAYLKAFDNDITLNAGTGLQEIRGAIPTLALLTWGRQTFVGLDMYMDLRLVRVREVGP